MSAPPPARRQPGTTATPPADACPIQALYAHLASDEGRNELIVRDVVAALEAGRAPLLDDQLELPFKARAGRAVVRVDGLNVNDRRMIVARCTTAAGRERRIPLQRLAAQPPAPLGWEWAEAHDRRATAAAGKRPGTV